MKYRCDIVRDLMPLYLDRVCSGESSRIVEEHLAECPECSRIYSFMKNSELEDRVRRESDDVLSRQAKYFKRKSAFIGAIIAGIFMIPVIVCLIVNLVSGNGLGWFFVVLSALLVASSLIIVPLMVPANKGLWTLGTFTGSLLFLIAVANLYAHSTAFIVAAPAILFAFAVVFLPMVIRAEPVAAMPVEHKGFWVMVIDTALFLLLLLAVAVHAHRPALFVRSIYFALPFIVFAWIIFSVIYFPKGGGLIKAGVCTVLIGALAFSAEALVNAMMGVTFVLPVFSPTMWTYETIDGNVKWIILLASLVLGVILMVAGVVAGNSRRSEK